MIEGIDYCFIYPKDDKTTVHIKLFTGPYKDTTFKFGKVKVQEEDEDGNAHLIFAYDVLSSTVDKPKKLEKNDEFKNYIGNFLVEMMTANIDEEYIDEIGTDDLEVSGVQRGVLPEGDPIS
jgi:hypothetical protein